VGGAVAVVGVAAGDETMRHDAMTIEPLRLDVGTKVTADARTLGPLEAEPAQAVENAADHLVGRAFEIGVFDPQHEHAAGAAGKEPVEQRGAGAADVEIAGGRW